MDRTRLVTAVLLVGAVLGALLAGAGAAQGASLNRGWDDSRTLSGPVLD